MKKGLVWETFVLYSFIFYSQLTTTKIKKMSKLNEEMMLLEKEQNKKDEPYRRVLSVSADAPKTRKANIYLH